MAGLIPLLLVFSVSGLASLALRDYRISATKQLFCATRLPYALPTPASKASTRPLTELTPAAYIWRIQAQHVGPSFITSLLLACTHTTRGWFGTHCCGIHKMMKADSVLLLLGPGFKELLVPTYFRELCSLGIPFIHLYACTRLFIVGTDGTHTLNFHLIEGPGRISRDGCMRLKPRLRCSRRKLLHLLFV